MPARAQAPPGPTTPPEGDTPEGDAPEADAPEEPQLVPPKMTDFVEAQIPAGVVPDVPVKVALSLEILADGTVGEVIVIEGAGEPYDAASVEAARKLVFTPALWLGQPVPVKVRFTYNFEPPPEPVPAAAGAAPGAAPAAGTPPAPMDLVGRVIERGTRKPLAGVLVAVGAGESTHEAETDADGRFELAVGPGAHHVVFFEAGHDRVELDEEVRAGERTELTVYLMPSSSARYRTVVRAKKPRREVTRTTLQKAELTQVAGTFGEPFRVIEALPGVARAPFTGGVLIVRGANPQFTGVYIDGHLIPLLYHFVVGSAVFNAELVRSIDFSPGNWSVRFGRKLGALVEVRTEDERPEKTRAEGELDLIKVGVLGLAPVSDSVDGFAGVRRSHLDAVLRGAGAVGLPSTSVSPRYWDYQVGAGIDLPGKWRSRIFAYGSDDGLEFIGDPGGEEDVGDDSEQSVVSIAFHRLIARAFRPLPLNGRVDLSTMLGVDFVELSQGEDGFLTTGLEAELRADLRVKPLETLTLEAGLDNVARRFIVDVNGPVPPAPWSFPTPDFDQLSPKFTQSTTLDQLMPAAYAAAEWTVLDRLTLVPGIRVDLVTGEGLRDFTVDPRAVARLRTWDWLTLKGGVGLFHQPPEAFQVAGEFGNTELTSQRAVHTSGGVEVGFEQDVSLDVTAYEIDRSNLITLSRRVLNTDTGVNSQVFDNDRRERSRGLEVLLRKQPGGAFHGWIAYTLSRTEQQETRESPWRLHRLDQPHVLTAVASVPLGWGFEVGSRIRLVSGNPTTPIVPWVEDPEGGTRVYGAAYDADMDTYLPRRGPVRSDRLPAFFQIDLRVDKRWTFETWMLNAYLDVLNLTNRANTEFVQYSHDYTARRLIPGVPILPSIGVKGVY